MFTRETNDIGMTIGAVIAFLLLVFAVLPFAVWLGWNVCICWALPIVPKIVGYWKLLVFGLGVGIIFSNGSISRATMSRRD